MDSNQCKEHDQEKTPKKSDENKITGQSPKSKSPYKKYGILPNILNHTRIKREPSPKSTSGSNTQEVCTTTLVRYDQETITCGRTPDQMEMNVNARKFFRKVPYDQETITCGGTPDQMEMNVNARKFFRKMDNGEEEEDSNV